MLIALVIAAVWLALAAFVVAACRTAARGDVAMAEAAEHIRRRATLSGVVLWERDEDLRAQDIRPRVGRPEPVGAGGHSLAGF